MKLPSDPRWLVLGVYAVTAMLAYGLKSPGDPAPQAITIGGHEVKVVAVPDRQWVAHARANGKDGSTLAWTRYDPLEKTAAIHLAAERWRGLIAHEALHAYQFLSTADYDTTPNRSCLQNYASTDPRKRAYHCGASEVAARHYQWLWKEKCGLRAYADLGVGRDAVCDDPPRPEASLRFAGIVSP